MYRHIARRELIDMLRDGRFRTSAAIILLLLAAAVVAGWRHYDAVSRQHAEAQRATRSQWLEQGEKNPHSAAHYGVYAFKPQSQLAIVDTGVDPYVGVAAWLEAHRQNEFRYRPAQDRGALLRFGELTAAEVLQVLLPLVVVLLGFSVFAGEREQGTLRQVMSLGVRPRDVVIGKAIGVAAAFGVIILPAVALGVAALLLASDSGILVTSWPRTGWLLAIHLAYAATFVALTLAVSAWAPSARLALVVLLSFWILNSLVASRVVADVAAELYPTPSAIELQTAIARDLDDGTAVERRLERRTRELLDAHGVEAVEALPIDIRGIAMQEGEEHGNEVFDRHYGGLAEQFQRQQRVHHLGGLAAPLVAMRSASMALAGTDLAHHQHFAGAAEEYRRLIQRIMNDDIAQNARPHAVYTAGHDLWASVPDFTYAPPGVGWALAGQWLSLTALVAWLLAGLAALAVTARRLRIE